ncbi:MAG: molecular chaperone TorD family protein [Bacteroidales bacterium]
MNEKNRNNLLKGYNMMLYFAGTMIMFDPRHECIFDFWSEGILKSLPVNSTNPNFIRAASLLRESVKEADIYSRMKTDYLRLFDESSQAIAIPRESRYFPVSTFPGEREMETVESFYNSYGWKSKFSGMIPDDHIGVELLFLTILIEKLLEFDDAACDRAMKAEISRFIRKHMLSWVGGWNDVVQEKSLTRSYKGIAWLIVSCCEDIVSIMEEKA